MYDVYKEVSFSQRNIYKLPKLFKSQNSIQYVDRAGRPTMLSTLEMENSANVLILAE